MRERGAEGPRGQGIEGTGNSGRRGGSLDTVGGEVQTLRPVGTIAQ